MDDNPQLNHYIKIHDSYSEHYYDETSKKYREQVCYPLLFNAIDLNNKEIADLACEIGVTFEAILARHPLAKITGFDLSPKACEAYNSRINRPAIQADLTKPLKAGKYDVAIIMSGLHHCVIDLTTTLDNISNLIKPGGSLLMYEPSSDFFLEGLRKAWYQKDAFFEPSSEHALSHDELLLNVKDQFELINVTYFGGHAY
jgi:2-polyprenyl-3-methyl-5-hydroxy-6-metoxy-1,4-benzoquinol methylase